MSNPLQFPHDPANNIPYLGMEFERWRWNGFAWEAIPAEGGPGSPGPPGPPGNPGTPGTAATVDVRQPTITLAPGQPAAVANLGTLSAAEFQFSIPQGLPGGSGDGGLTPEQAAVLAQISIDEYSNVAFASRLLAPNYYATMVPIDTQQQQGFTVPNLAWLGSLGFLQWNGSNWVRAPGNGLTTDQTAVLNRISIDASGPTAGTLRISGTAAVDTNFSVANLSVSNVLDTFANSVPNIQWISEQGFYSADNPPPGNGGGALTIPFHTGTPPVGPPGAVYWDDSEDAGHSRLFISYQDNWVATDAIKDRVTMDQVVPLDVPPGGVTMTGDPINIVAPVTDNNPLPLWMFNELNDTVVIISINIDAYLNKLQDLATRVDALENQALPPGQGHMTFVTQGGYAGGQTLDPPSAPFTISNANQIEAVTTSPGTASGSSQNWTVSKVIPMNGGWSTSPAIAFVSFAAVSGTVEIGTQGQVTMQAATTIQPGERVTWYPQVSNAGTCATTMILHFTPQ